jgi:hypothetical protein
MGGADGSVLRIAPLLAPAGPVSYAHKPCDAAAAASSYA